MRDFRMKFRIIFEGQPTYFFIYVKAKDEYEARQRSKIILNSNFLSCVAIHEIKFGVIDEVD